MAGRIACVVFLSGGAALACSSSPVTVSSTTGAEAGPCYANGTCNAGLVCFSLFCVRPPDAGAIDAGSDAAMIDPAIDAAAGAYAKAYCDKSTACLGSFGGFADAATCVARLKVWFTDELTAPGTGATPANLTDCAQKVTSASCTDWWTGSVCGARLGTRGVGEHCAHNAQCGTFVCLTYAGLCGTCVVAVPTGGSCSPSSECAGGNVCSSGTCVRYGMLGDACGAMQPCGFGLACRSGTCAKADAGSPCTPAAQDCQVGYFCSSVSSTCQQDQYAHPGGSCGFVAGDLSLWKDCLVGSCDVPVNQMTATCPDVAADGAPCDATKLCSYPAQCIGGTCQVPRASQCQ